MRIDGTIMYILQLGNYMRKSAHIIKSSSMLLRDFHQRKPTIEYLTA